MCLKFIAVNSDQIELKFMSARDLERMFESQSRILFLWKYYTVKFLHELYVYIAQNGVV